MLIFLPFKSTIQNFLIIFSQQFSAIPDNSSLTIKKLKRHNLLINIELNNLKRLKEENEKLKKALNFKERGGVNLTVVEIISFSPSQWHKSVIISCPVGKNLKKGLFAVNEEGNLLGKIVEVQDKYCRIDLVNDPNFNLPVFVGENKTGLLKGNINGAKILYIEADEKIKSGDEVWLRAGSSASAISIGKVKKVSQNPSSLFCDIDVTLLFQDYFFDQVFIIE
ncbi:MAG: rod shape-determining protein MreC [Candidatus Omnitrophota bacterium]